MATLSADCSRVQSHPRRFGPIALSSPLLEPSDHDAADDCEAGERAADRSFGLSVRDYSLAWSRRVQSDRDVILHPSSESAYMVGQLYLLQDRVSHCHSVATTLLASPYRRGRVPLSVFMESTHRAINIYMRTINGSPQPPGLRLETVWEPRGRAAQVGGRGAPSTTVARPTSSRRGDAVCGATAARPALTTTRAETGPAAPPSRLLDTGDVTVDGRGSQAGKCNRQGVTGIPERVRCRVL